MPRFRKKALSVDMPPSSFATRFRGTCGPGRGAVGTKTPPAPAAISPVKEATMVDLFRLVDEIARLFRARCDEELRLRIPGMTHARATVLAKLEKQSCISQSRLAEALGIRQMALVRLLDDLEQLGWVQRAPVVHDRRAWAVHLTDTGRETLSAIHDGRYAALEKATASIGPVVNAELMQFLVGLKQGLLRDGSRR